MLGLREETIQVLLSHSKRACLKLQVIDLWHNRAHLKIGLPFSGKAYALYFALLPYASSFLRTAVISTLFEMDRTCSGCESYTG